MNYKHSKEKANNLEISRRPRGVTPSIHVAHNLMVRVSGSHLINKAQVAERVDATGDSPVVLITALHGLSQKTTVFNQRINLEDYHVEFDSQPCAFNNFPVHSHILSTHKTKVNVIKNNIVSEVYGGKHE